MSESSPSKALGAIKEDDVPAPPQDDAQALRSALLAVFSTEHPRGSEDHTTLRCRSMQVFKTSS